MFFRAAAFRAAAFAARFLGATGDTPPSEPPVEPPVTTPPATINLFGGVGGIRHELTDREREELHRRIRKSLGLDKEPPPAPVEVPSIVAPISSAVIRVHTAANDALEREDDEIVLLATACW